ncbi:MAG: UDP-N-acetylmuramoyl-L-alanine--D-glutamate ligase, partial [Verrucomicrobia bacterium]|nr:UDP-N-acetylmuramoyl-L-alanine--D-glutamate ligase [Verrucomicrobiota bacterium]
MLGLGRSGLAAADWLLAQGAEVTMFDESQSPAMQDLAPTWRKRGGVVVTGVPRLPETRFAAAILSPGVDPRRPVVGQLRQAGVRILGELELGAQACLCPIVAVTGTNGKSTTTELIHEIYQAAGKKSVACGNLGRPLCEVAPLTQNLDRVVAEVSSFQLESIETFHPRISVYLNLTPDHLDRYESMKQYGEAKL